MSRQTLLALALAVAGLAPTPSFAGLTLTVAKYDSPTFSNGSSFVVGGGTQTINLTPGQTQDVTLDTSSSLTLSFSPGTHIYTGTVTSDITLDGITKTISYTYTYTSMIGQNSGSFSLAWTGGPAVDFDLGNNVEVTVLPLNSNDRRKATFLEIGGSAVPEPSSAVLAMIGAGSIAASGLARRGRARRRPADAGYTRPTE